MNIADCARPGPFQGPGMTVTTTNRHAVATVYIAFPLVRVTYIMPLPDLRLTYPTLMFEM